MNKIVADGTRIVNRGIPVDKIAAATHTRVRQVAIHETTAPSTFGTRAEHLDAGGKTLSVSRPHNSLPPRTPATLAGRSTPAQAGSPSSSFSAGPSRSPQPVKIQSPGRPAVAVMQEKQRDPAQAPANSGINTPRRFAAKDQASREDRTAPLIIRGSRSANREPSVTDSQNYIAQSPRHQPVQSQANVPAAQAQQQSPYRFSSTPRSVEGRPRYEQPSSEARTEQQPIVRSEAQNRWTAPPAFATPTTPHQHYSGSSYQPRHESYRNTAPSFAAPAHVSREPQVSQPHVQTHSAAIPSAPAASHDHSSSSDKRGR